MNDIKQDIVKDEIRESLSHVINLKWVKKLDWFITLRWIACITVFFSIIITRFVFGIPLPLFMLLIGNIVLCFCNLLFSLYDLKLKRQNKVDRQFFKKANRFANVQISTDLFILVYLIHFSGGIENPFIFYSIFHMVIASILLSNKAAYLQSSFAMVLFGLVIFGEYFKILPHYHLFGFVNEELYLNTFYLSGIYFILVSTLYMTIYLTTSIVNKLREEENNLVIANKKLEEQDRLKSQYVQTVSHDLQASLATIQTCLNVVLTNLVGDIPEKAREMIVRAEQRSQTVLNFVKDLLDLSRIRGNKEIVKKPVYLSKVIKKVVGELLSKAQKKGLNITMSNVNNNSSVYGNQDNLEQIMNNLVINAIKYTPYGGNINVQMKEKQAFYEVSVSDNGIGISQEDIPYIFEDFFRAKNAEQMEKDGTGLGLSIVKQIIKEHKGDIWVESQVGKGSKFSFKIPKNN